MLNIDLPKLLPQCPNYLKKDCTGQMEQWSKESSRSFAYKKSGRPDSLSTAASFTWDKSEISDSLHSNGN